MDGVCDYEGCDRDATEELLSGPGAGVEGCAKHIDTLVRSASEKDELSSFTPIICSVPLERLRGWRLSMMWIEGYCAAQSVNLPPALLSTMRGIEQACGEQ